jgi:hypothetical protein
MMWLNRISTSMKKVLQQGMSPEKVALSVTLGGTLGVIPIPGLSTGLCIVAASVLRLNHAVIQMFNYAAYPLQLLLLGVYVALGNQWFGSNVSVDSFKALSTFLQNDFWTNVLLLKNIAFHATVAWLATSPLLAIVVYFSARFAAIRIKRTVLQYDGAPKNPLTAEQDVKMHLISNQQTEAERASDRWPRSGSQGCATCRI